MRDAVVSWRERTLGAPPAGANGHLGPSGRREPAAGAAAALLAGAPLFVVALADRASDLEKFAHRRGPGWPFLTYSGLHVGGLAALGTALLLLPVKPWTGITAAGSVPVFSAILAGTKDIPPFVFYLVEAAVGVQLMRHEESELPAGSQRGGESLG